MFKKIVTLGVVCAAIAGTATETEAAAGSSLFHDGTHKVITGAAVRDIDNDVLFDDRSENLLVAKAGSPDVVNRKNMSKSLKLSDLKKFTPAARIVSHEGGGERIAVKTNVSVNQGNRIAAVQKTVLKPVIEKRKSEVAISKIDVDNKAVEGDSSVFNFDSPLPDKEPVSFKSAAFNEKEPADDVILKDINKADTEAESYRHEIFGSSFVSDSGAIISDHSSKRVPAIPSVREESDYQLLDYTNGIINKIYTKVGYATVVILPPGEKLNRVTLGDRQRFNVQNVFDKSSGSWHIYLKPMQMDIETNMVISTNRHLFNATLATSDFFKPFAKWINVPGTLESVGVDDGALDLAVKDVNQLNFAYSRQGKSDFSWAPLNVFDDKDGHTFINFDAAALVKTRPLVFTCGADGKMKMVPYAVYRNTYVIDNIYDNLEVRSGSKSVKFIRKS